MRPLILGLVASLTFATLSSLAQDEPVKKTFFLPKSATAAAYVLNRLSNKELTEAPRSEFVYVALLQRKGLDRKYRLEALDGIAKARNTDALTELLGGINDLDKKGEESEPVLRDLAALLLQNPAAKLTPQRENLEKLTSEGQLPLTHQIGYAALLTADGSPEKTWASVATEPAKLAELLQGIPLLRDAALRTSLYSKVEPLVHKTDSADVQRAAISALASLPGHDVETFGTLAALVKSGTERAAAVAGLQRLPRKSWPKDQAEPLVDALLTYLPTVSVEKRTDAEFLSAFQLATDLATILPSEKSRAVGKTLRGIGVSVFVVRTINEQMLYDKTLIVVEAGKPVEIILMNEDSMPHNLVVVAPGALEEIGEAAEKMAPDPDAEGRIHIPKSPKVLYCTRMVEPGQQIKLSFTAPETPGDYQYVCTFPGHWRRMVGTLAVVKDVEAYLASRAAAPEPVMTEWKLEDLQPDLAKSATGRNLTTGREFFQKLACVQCHKLGSEGYAYGPDLSDLFQRYKGDRAAVLQQVLEPSKIIADRYRNFQFELADGDQISGMILKEDAATVTIQTGASDTLIKNLKKTEIKTRELQTSSLMPMGLLNMLSKDQIYDLLAYLESGAVSHEGHNH